jgi:outer membrane protein TolC
MRKILYSLALAIPLFAETLDELVTYATTHSTAVKQAKVQSELATLNRKQNQAGMYGELDLVGSVTHYNLDRTLAPLTPTVIASGQPITTSKDLYFAGINYNLPLFTGFAQTREVEMDKIAEKMADVRHKLTKEQLA